MFVLLPLLLLVLAAHLSTCNASAAASASTVSKTTEIGGVELDTYSLLPVAPYDANSEARQAMLEETLAPFLITPLIDIVAEYSRNRCRQFAESLYAELWEGKTDLLCKELYDVEKKVLKEGHYFWDYLSEGAQPVVVFVYMLQEVQKKHVKLKEQLKSFAVLALERVPSAGYFIRKHFADDFCFMLRSTSVDEWPQALLNDEDYLRSLG